MKRAALMFVALASLVAGAGRASANLLVNGDFENEPNYGNGVANGTGFSALTGTQIPGWTIEPNHAATVHGYGVYPQISGNFSINTDGEGYMNNNANMYQDFSSALGTSYNLRFDWESWQNNAPATQLEVSVADTATNAVLFDGLYSYGGNQIVYHESATFLGTGDTLRLRIQETPQSGFNDNQFIVDNFSVDPVPSAAPEPASAVLFGLALTGLGGYAWRRRRRGLPAC